MRINHVVRTLIVADFFVNSGLSIFGPTFAVFVTGQIQGGSLEVVGFGAAIAQLFKVIFQVPIANYLDRNHGEYDDFYSLIAGNILIVLVPFLYFFADKAAHIYIIQAIFGLGMAMAIPPWYAIFTRHIDHFKESLEWSLDSTAIGIGIAGAAALGGWLAEKVGFQNLFLIGGILASSGMVIQMMIYRDLRAKVPRGMVKPQPDRAA